MKRLMAGSLGLTLSLWAAAGYSEEYQWRPAATSTAQNSQAASPVESSSSDKTTSADADNGRPRLGRPRAASLERPVAMGEVVSQPSPFPLLDPSLRPASFSPSVDQNPLANQAMPVYRAQKLEEFSKPLPVGKPVARTVSKTAVIDSREDNYNQRVVTENAKPGPGLGPQPLVEETSPRRLTPIPSGSPSVFNDTCGMGDCCEGGACCGENLCCEDACTRSSLFWIRGEYLLWKTKNPRSPALVSTSAPSSLGILGPGTTVLFGGEIENEYQSGGRFTAGMWFDACERFGIEGSFFFIDQRSVNFQASSQGNPVLARPFFNTFTGAEDAEQVANPTIPGFPNVLPLTGTIGVTSKTRLWGAELNGIANLYKWDWGRLDFLGGFRYVHLDERLEIDENLLVPASSPMFAGTSFGVTDRFTTRNQFFGEQIGLRSTFNWRRWDLELSGKVAFGVNHQVVDINGSTTISSPGSAPSVYAGGLLAQPTNIGHYNQDKFAVVPEGGINIGYHFNDHWRAFVGYNVLYLSSVVRPGDQIDRGVNVSQLPPGTLSGSARPTFRFRETDFWAQGMNVGLEFKY